MTPLEKILGLEGKQIEPGCVLTIGNFDGVHLGHREIINVAKKHAAERKTSLVVMSFEPHPLAVLHPKKAPEILTPALLKQQIFCDLGVDYHLVLNASSETLSLSAEDFVRRFLIDGVRPAVLVEGEDFSFGARRSGSIRTLREMASEGAFEVVAVAAMRIEIPDGETLRISSTMIRYMLGSGRVADAAAALGRPYRLIGRICSGRGKGKELGFPTLNMSKPEQLIPAEGVYAGFVQLADGQTELCRVAERIPAVFSLGQARTFGDEHPLLIEAHLLVGGAEGLSGRYMAMDFIDNIRTQHKFASAEQLVKQIARDCRTAADILGVAAP